VIKATITGVDVTVSGLQSVGVDVREAAYYAVVEALEKAFQASKALISADDHTLRALALLGHPYGYRHPAQIHDPDIIIHAQRGEYLAALRANPPVGLATSIIEGSIVNDSPLDRWLQEGTTKMRARPWMEYIVKEYGDDFAALIEARILSAIQENAA
jgi:hypothetical protein